MGTQMTRSQPGPSAVGIGALELFAPDGSCVATLIKQVAHQSIQIAVPDREREDWPRPGDTERTGLHWPEPDKWFFPNTDTLRQRMDELLNDEQRDKGGFFL
jgi:hypothetical protein